MNNHNIVLNADSYKYSQWCQYPPKTTVVYSYIESRGGKYDATVFFGLQAFIKEYLLTPININMIDEAEAIITAHGEPFNRAGWIYILMEHDGYLPVTIKAAPEGLVIPTGNVLVTIENTDPNCYWLTSFLETALLRAVWYPTTVATNSYENKKLILDYLEKTGDPTAIAFKLHDFGARGVSSLESAGLGGLAHLVNFMGTDTVEALLAARRYYGADMAGFSVPAMEHSTVTSWGRENEVASYRNMVKVNGKPGGIVSAVSDSYDIFNACKLWGTELKQDVLDSGATLVVRPDSGDPADIVLKCLKILDQYFGHTVNAKGYKVLNNVRVLQGDGINHASIRSILYTATLAGYSADNIVFGQGGALLQIVNRDDQKFAMKASAALVNGTWVDVYKDPITDKGKRSKKGKLELIQHKDGTFTTMREEEVAETCVGSDMRMLETVFQNGELFRDMTFDEVRTNAQIR
jgi:nicotinamide phosphoribosyltransferase